MILFLGASLMVAAQPDRKAAELKNLEKSLFSAKAKVTQAQKQMAAADSLINLGYQMIKESKTETKSVYSESSKLEKDYAAKHKPLEKLSGSKDRAESAKARVDLKALDTQYKTDNLSLEKKLKGAERKQTTGSSLVVRGKTAKLNARDALKSANAALKIAQDKYDAATAPPKEDKSKKK